MKTEVISMCVPAEVAQAIRRIAEGEDRSLSKVAGRILQRGLRSNPVPAAQFARRSQRYSKTEGRK